MVSAAIASSGAARVRGGGKRRGWNRWNPAK